MPRKPKHNHSMAVTMLTVLILLMIAATVWVFRLCLELSSQLPEASSKPGATIALPTHPEETTQAATAPTETAATEPEYTVATATVGVVGDLLMHKQLFQQASKSVSYQADGSYDFSAIFQYVQEYTQSYDYAVANLETTLSGDDYPYQGNPHFNCPDALLDSVQDAGFDMLLTANNHINDCKQPGLLRTMEQIQSKGLAYLGSRQSQEEPRYSVVDVNGIRIGMVCYTFTTSMLGDKPRLNGDNPMEDPALINYFSTGKLNAFYSEMEEVYAGMEAAGAEATALYIHWGNEYELTQNATQEKIAQKMCDMGFDVIVGGHPHVVQPMDLLESTVDPDHKTVCIYSLGNVVSNQRIAEMRLKTGHTEDGVLLTMTFEKDLNGDVFLSATDVLPTWTNMHYNNGGREYNIVPLENARRDQWAELYGLDDSTLAQAEASYDRTREMVGQGLEKCQSWLTDRNTARELGYRANAA